MMRWFKSKKNKHGDQERAQLPTSPQLRYNTPRPAGIAVTKLPPHVLEHIFTFVCPHSLDESYDNCEQSALEDTCMLCDLRDVAHCVQVNLKWRTAAVKVLYNSIRIDVVHYCPLENELAERRKRRSFMNRNAEPEDAPQTRIRLLCRTLRDDRVGLHLLVKSLKIPYMTREVCKADIARIVGVLPNLRYVDLPEGVFTDDPSCHALKQEVQARCPDMRKMSYVGGSEKSLELLAGGSLWRNLEVLELTRLVVDNTILRCALGYLPSLRALKVSDVVAFDDSLFEANSRLPPFPALAELIFEDIPNLTARGLMTHLFRSDSQNALTTLSLTRTGIHPADLHHILATAPSITFLSIDESVSSPFPPSDAVQPLSSKSLEILHFEITSENPSNSYINTTIGYYAHLRSSLVSDCLPNLRQLYVRDPDFPESLVDLGPPAPAFISDADSYAPPKSFGHSPSSSFSSTSRFSSNNPFAAAIQPATCLRQELEVFSKGAEEMEWNFSRVQPPKELGRRGSSNAPRPLSSYGLNENLNRGWGQSGGARKSVIVGNGFGGFLAVPSEDGVRPGSVSGEKRRVVSRYDMWR